MGETSVEVDKTENGEDLIQGLVSDLVKARQCAEHLPAKPRVTFIFWQGNDTPASWRQKDAERCVDQVGGREIAITEIEQYDPSDSNPLCSPFKKYLYTVHQHLNYLMARSFA